MKLLINSMQLRQLKIFMFFLYEILNASGETVITNIGENVQLVCKFNHKKAQRIQWLFSSPANVEQTIYDSYLNQTNNDYSISCITDQLYCNITIHNVSKYNAGRYGCLVAESFQDSSALVNTFDLVVGDVKCFSTLNGKSCNENHPNLLKRKCSAYFYGNVGEKFQLSWIAKKGNGDLVIEDHMDVQYFHNKELLKCEMEDKIEMTFNMDDMIFECHVNNHPQIKPCSLQHSLEHVSPPELNHQKMKKDNLHSVTCNVTKTTSVTCSYLWKYRIGNDLLEFPNQLLTVENMEHSGIYTCMVRCEGNSMTNCRFKAMTIEVVETASLEKLPPLPVNRTGMIIAIVIPTCLLLAALIYIVIMQRKKSQWKARNANKAVVENFLDLFMKARNTEKEVMINFLDQYMKRDPNVSSALTEKI